MAQVNDYFFLLNNSAGVYIRNKTTMMHTAEYIAQRSEDELRTIRRQMLAEKKQLISDAQGEISTELLKKVRACEDKYKLYEPYWYDMDVIHSGLVGRELYDARCAEVDKVLEHYPDNKGAQIMRAHLTKWVGEADTWSDAPYTEDDYNYDEMYEGYERGFSFDIKMSALPYVSREYDGIQFPLCDDREVKQTILFERPLPEIVAIRRAALYLDGVIDGEYWYRFAEENLDGKKRHQCKRRSDILRVFLIDRMRMKVRDGKRILAIYGYATPWPESSRT